MVDISGITGIVQETATTTSVTGNFGRDDFLKLFLAQLNNQDPLNPMESQEFTAQLAQFSSLEQLYNVNENLDSIRTLQDSDTRFQALGLIGKEIVAEGDTLSLTEGLGATGGFVLESAADVTVVVTDLDGLPVRELALGELDAGTCTFEWDGLDDTGNRMEPGSYAFEVTAVNEAGELVAVETRTTGEVTRVSLDGDDPLVYLGDLPVELSRVIDVRIPASSTVADGEGTDGT
ncbi:MAG: flagellar hook assembly protein FlgD [Deltaproteobacteria bacterium]|nr:flagellar hook assembly protein FlgD [Deltaproteobacteria bacterium]